MENAPFDATSFVSYLRTRAIGRSLEYQLSTPSTMDDARALALSGAEHGSLSLAEEQTAGRGRRGRAFQSPRGENLYFTLILRLDIDALRRVPVAVPLAVCHACRETGVDARIKWPNDIWIYDRKVCGMLIDSEIEQDGSLAFPGIGINVNGDPTTIAELADVATSLRLELGAPVNREALLADICNRLEAILELPLDEMLRQYRGVSMILGRRVTVSESEGASYEAMAVDLAEDGALVVEVPGGERRTVVAGDVTVRPA